MRADLYASGANIASRRRPLLRKPCRWHEFKPGQQLGRTTGWRLARDHPDVLARYERGEFKSAHLATLI